MLIALHGLSHLIVMALVPVRPVIGLHFPMLTFFFPSHSLYVTKCLKICSVFKNIQMKLILFIYFYILFITLRLAVLDLPSCSGFSLVTVTGATP